jgi:hypothetical protein
VAEQALEISGIGVESSIIAPGVLHCKMFYAYITDKSSDFAAK